MSAQVATTILGSSSEIGLAHSTGAGVQSTAMYLAACDGLIELPDVCVFADTGGEPQYVYDHLDRLEAWGKANGGPPIVRVSSGVLHDDMFTKRSVSPPLWIKKSESGDLALGGRWCTDKYKTRPVVKFLRQHFGVPRGCKTPMVRVALGISTDERLRQKSSREPWMVYVHPLLASYEEPDGLGWSRERCREYLDSKGWGDTPKSACAYCPYHEDELWAEVKALDPVAFDLACDLDERARHGTRGEDEGGKEYFFHRSLIPLRDVTLPSYVPGASDKSVGCSPFSCPRDGSQMSLLDDVEGDAA